MRQSGAAKAPTFSFSAQVVGERVCSFLRARHPHHTADLVARDTDTSVTTVRKWLERSSAPNAVGIGKLMDAYGPDFAAEVFGLDWLREAARARELSTLQEQRDALDARIARLGA